MASDVTALSNHTDAHHTGKCLCGQISYEITGQPIFIALCHCVNCKKWTGTGSGWYAFFNKEQVHFTQGQDTLSTYTDTDTFRGTTLLRNFCPTCGSNLTAVLTSRHELTGVTAGTIEGDICEVYKPQIEVYCKDRPKWLPELGMKQFDITPNVSRA
ncbi:Mss4-like protein [Irpex rosettiformis]|uniref:Mss4-like protein n=1 Tax=Irpex rosettiformis TaxID=378272 RepID=A0ACB8UE48_9APHY|nr:Mss4-like protein [Irpex rosettiformis]